MADNDGYTKTPNDLLDEVMHLVPASVTLVLLVINRKTLGWRKEWDVISFTQFEELTGLTRPTVITAVEFAVKAQLAERRPAPRNGFAYRLSLVKFFNWSNNFTSKKILLVEVKKLYQSSAPTSKKTLHTKESNKETNKEKGARAKRSRAKDVNQDHPACGVFHELTSRRPNKVQAALIAETVDDLDRWRKVLEFWLGQGWKPTSVAGMIDRYKNRGNHEQHRSSNKGSSTPNVNRRGNPGTGSTSAERQAEYAQLIADATASGHD